MKKVLYLSLVTCSIFSMKLDSIRDNCLRAKTIQQKLKRHLSKSNKVKQQKPISNDSIDSIKQSISSSAVFASKRLGEIKLFHNEKGFHVLHNDKMHYVQPCFTDKIVRKATPLEIKDFQKVGKGYFAINQMSNGEFELKVKDRLCGGGVGGATIGFYIGRFGTYFLLHGAIGVASALTGPAALATFAGLEACFAPHIEATAQLVSLAGGIIGGVATGPV